MAKEFANHPAKGLTPAKLAHILIEAEQGHLQAQAELFMDMEERDAHLFAEMSKRKRAVLGLGLDHRAAAQRLGRREGRRGVSPRAAARPGGH
nr:DUF935 family protein [Pseudomonas aeruginosa]